MKYAIIEDEEFARENLREIIEKIRPDYELVGSLGSVEESLLFLQTHEIDLLFLDIELGDGTGFDLIEQAHIKVPVIFTTAYSEHTLKAFKVNSIDYLLKPVTEADVTCALEKLEMMPDIFAPAVTHRPRPVRDKVDRLLISRSKSFSFLKIKSIAFFCIEDRYVMVYTKSGLCEVTDMKNLEEVMAVVSGHDFFQVSRSVVSSISAIYSVDKIDNQRLLVVIHAGPIQKRVTISATRRKEFLAWLGQ